MLLLKRGKVILNIKGSEIMRELTALHGAYYPNNFGDVLILAIQSKWIKEITKKDVVLPFATEIYRKTIESSYLKGIEGLKASNKLVYGAGGYLGEPMIRKWEWGFKFFKKHVVPAEYCNFKKIDYAIISPGFGPITNLFTRSEVIRICKHSKIIVLRDIESKNYLVQYGIPEDKVIVTADVALSLTKDDIPNDSVERIKDIFAGSTNLKYGVHVGADIDSSKYGDKAQMILDDCIKFFNENKHITPVLIKDNKNPAQKKAVDYLKDHIENNCVVYQHEDIWDTCALLAECEFVLTNKLHIGIVSYALGNTPLSFPYHPKTIRFYKQINQESLCTPILNIEDGTVLDTLNRTVNNEWKTEIELISNKRRPELRELALKNKYYLEKFILDTL